MKRIKKFKKEFEGDEGSLIIIHNNRGEPFREGYEIQICEKREWGDESIEACFLQKRELKELRDYLNEVLS